jgi:soluble lytic murein transglycosylase-like protein
MEKRPEKTLARTLVCGCVKLLLLCALFAPAFLTFKKFSEQADQRAGVSRANIANVVEKPRSKELVKIYSIVRSHRADVTDAEAWRVAEVIMEESAKRKIDPLLVLALIQVESGFQYDVVSPSGARGLMQIMPDTGRSLTHALGREYGLRPVAFRPESLDDPLLNIRLGIYYLHDLKRQFRDLNLALSAYNCGPVEIQNRLENKVDFPLDFASLVLDAYQRYQNAKHPAF